MTAGQTTTGPPGEFGANKIKEINHHATERDQ
jgi:hypothetical protein